MEQLTKKQRRALNKQQKILSHEERNKSERKQRMLMWSILLIVVVAIIAGTVWIAGTTRTNGVLAQAITDNEWEIGGKDASVTIVEYSDFQCPACRQFYNNSHDLLDEMGHDVRFIYRHFPLTRIHSNAERAAQAAEAAGAQGMFWEMHDVLFESQTNWSELNDPSDHFKQLAKNLKLDEARFATDYEAKSTKQAVDEDATGAQQAQLRGTPTIFINGEQVPTPQTKNALRDLITQTRE